MRVQEQQSNHSFDNKRHFLFIRWTQIKSDTTERAKEGLRNLEVQHDRKNSPFLAGKQQIINIRTPHSNNTNVHSSYITAKPHNPFHVLLALSTRTTTTTTKNAPSKTEGQKQFTIIIFRSALGASAREHANARVRTTRNNQ